MGSVNGPRAAIFSVCCFLVARCRLFSDRAGQRLRLHTSPRSRLSPAWACFKACCRASPSLPASGTSINASKLITGRLRITFKCCTLKNMANSMSYSHKGTQGHSCLGRASRKGSHRRCLLSPAILRGGRKLLPGAHVAKRIVSPEARLLQNCFYMPCHFENLLPPARWNQSAICSKRPYLQIHCRRCDARAVFPD